MHKILSFSIAIFAIIFSNAQGSESFTNIPANSASYTLQTWVGDNALSWSASDARTDQVLTTRAICIRNGAITCNSIANGLASLSFKHQQVFSGSGGLLEIRVNGILVGSANPTTTIATTTIDNINVSGAFNLEIKQVTAGLRIVVDDVSWTGYNGSPCVTPTTQPTGLNFSSIGNNSLAFSFSPAVPAPNEYLVVRSNSNSLTTLPSDGVVYTEGNVLGNGVVVDKSTALTYNLTGLTQATTYYFFVFSVNSTCSGGPKYLTSNPLTSNVTTTAPLACVAPTQIPTNLILLPTATSVNGNFIASNDADGYLIVRSASNTLTALPVNGVSYTVNTSFGGGTIVKFGVGNTFSNTSLSALTTYHYFVFALNSFNCTGGPIYNTTSLKASITTTSSATGEPTGYYSSISGLGCSSLKTSLKNIITTGHNLKNYSDLYSQYEETDVKPREVGSGSAKVIWDIYSDNPTGPDPYNYNPSTQQCGSYSNEGDCFNREHTFPQSWFTTGTFVGPGTDYIQVLPTDGSVNGRRSNFLYGEVATASYTSLNGSKLGNSSVAGVSGTVFEPINTYKGDVARIFLYMVTRYQDDITTWANLSSNGAPGLAANTFPSVNISYLKLMIKWHNQDPVSQKEIERNNGAYSFQGNRNPFVDRPELVDAVWNSTCPGLSALPVDILFFAGKLLENKVALEWQVGTEINVANYIIERSYDGYTFDIIGEVKAENKKTYNFNDNVNQFTGKQLWYRIKKQDKNGNYAYSEIFSINIPSNVKFTVFPNPTKNYIHVKFSQTTINQKASFYIIDAMGKIVLNQTTTISNNSNYINLQSINTGTYVLKALINNEVYTQKIIVTK